MTEKQSHKIPICKRKSRIKLLLCSIFNFLSNNLLYFHLQDRDNILISFNSNKELICKVQSTKINVSKKIIGFMKITISAKFAHWYKKRQPS